MSDKDGPLTIEEVHSDEFAKIFNTKTIPTIRVVRNRISQLEKEAKFNRLAKHELDGILEILHWLKCLILMLNSSPSKFLREFGMMSVGNPYQLNAKDDSEPDWDYPSLDWHKNNEKLFNQMIWEVCRAYGIQRLRRNYRNSIAKAKPWNEEDPTLRGKHFPVEDEKELLENFLTAKPHPDWVL